MKAFQNITAIFIGIFLSAISYAQEIDFGSYYNYSVTLNEVGIDGLDFGVILTGGGPSSIEIANATIVTITGVKYLDIFVTIDADDELLLGANPACSGISTCSFDFDLEAAYTNKGSDNINNVNIIPVANNNGTARFPILHRTSAHPAPPPTPTYEGYNPALYEDTAYLYLYGTITVGMVDAGSYIGNITVTVSYD